MVIWTAICFLAFMFTVMYTVYLEALEDNMIPVAVCTVISISVIAILEYHLRAPPDPPGWQQICTQKNGAIETKYVQAPNDKPRYFDTCTLPNTSAP